MYDVGRGVLNDDRKKAPADCQGRQSEGSRRDRGPKESSEEVGVNKMRLGPDDINLQTKELHCNYSVLIESPE